MRSKRLRWHRLRYLGETISLDILQEQRVPILDSVNLSGGSSSGSPSPTCWRWTRELRTIHVEEAPVVIPFRIERWMSTYEHDVDLNLAESGAQQLTLGQLLDRAEATLSVRPREMLEDTVLTYNETRGSEELRRRLAALYEATPADILVTCGAIEANYLLFQTLLAPGDVVVSMFPSYQQLYSLAEMCGAEVRLWCLEADDGFRPDLEALESLLDESVSCIVLNTPHNPTGAVLQRDQIEQISAWAAEIDAYIVSDETYQDLSLEDGADLAPPARSLSSRAISVSSTSKNLGLAGLRIGWIAATPEVVERCWHYRDYTTISPARLSDVLACLALDLRPQLVARSRRLARSNLSTLSAWMKEHGEHFEWIPPRAGLLAFPRLRRFSDSRAFCRALIEEESVLLGPGWAFELEGHIRIGIGEDPDVFEQGLQRMHDFLLRS